jgi:hypothetical protein
MKTKNWILPILLLPAILSSCSRYQYSTISSNLKQNQRQEFYTENDSFKVVYNFNGYDGPVQISVHNKVNKPLFVDWKKSAVIIDGRSNSFWRDQATISGETQHYQVQWTEWLASANGSVSATMSRPDQFSFVPPQSYTQVSMINLKREIFKFKRPKRPTAVNLYTETGTVNMLAYYFDDDNSPLRYKTYLTLSYQPDLTQPIELQHDFWVSEVMNTHSAPRAVAPKSSNGDTFYMKKITGFGTFMGIVTFTGLVILGASAN